MNRWEAETTLDRLRRDGVIVVSLLQVADVQEWRREVRGIARRAGMRIRTTVHLRRGFALADHLDHVTTDIELAALRRLGAGGRDGAPVTWAEALDCERRAAIHLVSDRPDAR